LSFHQRDWKRFSAFTTERQIPRVAARRSINGRGHSLNVDGDPRDVETVERILDDFSQLFAEGRQFTDKSCAKPSSKRRRSRLQSARLFHSLALQPAGKKQVTPKSAMQRKYVETIQQKDIVFGIGPAGTGKTYLGVAMAVQA